MRPTIDNRIMQTAVLWSERTTCKRKKVGAVIALPNGALLPGYAGAPAGEPHCLDEGCIMENGGCVRTDHAEFNAIKKAMQLGLDIGGATIFITLSPCTMCAKLIYNIGITKVVYLEEYRKTEGVDYLKSKGVECEQFMGEIVIEAGKIGMAGANAHLDKLEIHSQGSVWGGTVSGFKAYSDDYKEAIINIRMEDYERGVK